MFAGVHFRLEFKGKIFERDLEAECLKVTGYTMVQRSDTFTALLFGPPTTWVTL